MKNSLPKILYAMDLSDPVEMKNAEEMLKQYPSLAIEDILQLLSKSMKNEVVREFAVKQLDKNCNDAELELYLLQLVQALRYEKQLYSIEEKEEIVIVSPQTPVQEIQEVEEKKQVEQVSEEMSKQPEQPIEQPTEQPIEQPIEQSVQSEPVTPGEEIKQTKLVITPVSPLLVLLIHRCAHKRSLASLFLHYIRVEGNGNAPNPKDRNTGNQYFFFFSIYRFHYDRVCFY